MEKNLINERNITENNRPWPEKNKAKSKERKDSNLEKMNLKMIYSQLLEEKQNKSGEHNKFISPSI